MEAFIIVAVWHWVKMKRLAEEGISSKICLKPMNWLTAYSSFLLKLLQTNGCNLLSVARDEARG